MTLPPTGVSPLLSVRALRSRTGHLIDLDVAQGECLCIVGKSGSGKSVLLRLLADLDPGEGTVTLDGVERNSGTGPEWRRRVIYQAAEPAWWGDTVRDHFPQPAHAELDAWMTEVGLPRDMLDAELPRLSTGERQRLALLRSLARNPRVLLLDEPTASLDQQTTLAIEALLMRLLASGLAIVMVTHSPEQAQRMGHRRFEMKEGELTAA